MRFFIFLLSLLFVYPEAAFPQSVSAAGSLNTARWFRQSQLLSNGKVLAFGGDHCSFTNPMRFASAELYHPQSNTWTYTGSMSDERTVFACTGTGIFTSSLSGLYFGTTYYVRAFAINSAGVAYGQEISFVTTLGMGVNNNGLQNNISIYPNPGNGMITLDVHSLSSDYLETKIMNSNGIVVYTNRKNNFSGNYKETLDLTFLSKGFYSIQIITVHGVFTEKLVISE